MAEKIVVAGDIGTLIRLRVREGTKKTDPLVNLTGVTLTKFLVRKPNPASLENGTFVDVEWTAVVEGLATAGTLAYTTVAGDIDVPGTYIVQAKVEFGGLSRFHSTPVELLVRAIRRV